MEVGEPMDRIWLGTSGWEYPEWVGPVYPHGHAVDHLRSYADRFPIVEVNSTFYRLPPPARAADWVRRTPKGFRFAAKFPQEITHERRLVDAEEPLERFRAVVRPLQEAGKFVAALLQLPPSLPFEAGTVRRFYEILPTDLPTAVEFREPSWLSPESFDLLREFKLAYVIVDEPMLPIRLEVTGPFAYVRWHGHGQPVWYDYRYAPDELSDWVPKLAALETQVDRVYGFFNNHFRGDAVTNALMLRDALGLSAPPWTSQLDAGPLTGPGAERPSA
jgi:uncharacterized protein YecE (DUF72 family)